MPETTVGGSFVRRGRRTGTLVRMLVPREIRVRYRQSILDIAWALVVPVVTLILYGLVLTQSFGVESSCGPYLASAWTGLVLWTFFATAVGTSVTSLVGSADLITKIYFPREALPLSMVGAASVDLTVGVVINVVLALVLGVPVSITWLGAILPVLVVVVWAAALSVIVAALAPFARDLIHAVHLALRVGFIVVPVMYEADFLPPFLAWTATVNPLAASITAAREALYCTTWPSTSLLAAHLLLGVGLLAGGVAYTSSVESRITDVV